MSTSIDVWCHLVHIVLLRENGKALAAVRTSIAMYGRFVRASDALELWVGGRGKKDGRLSSSPWFVQV